MFGPKQTTAASTGFTFPQATATTGSTLFGGGAPTSTGFPAAQPQQQQGFSGFSFPQAQPAASQPSTGFQLPTANTVAAPNVSLFGSTLGGQNKPAAPVGFGTLQATPGAQPTLGFGTQQVTSAAQPTLGFGTQQVTSAAQPTMGFGTPQATSAALPTMGFGTPQTTSAAQPTMGFGAPQTTSAVQPTMGFGTPQAAPAAMGFGFNAPKTVAAAPATTASTGFSFGFGTPATTASAAPASNLNFGLGSNSTTTPAPTLTAATSAPGTTLGFNLGAAPLTTTSTGLTFPAPTSTSTPTLSFGVGTTLTAASTAAPAFGLPGAATTVTSSAPSSVPTLGGLGGTTSFNIGKGTSLATKPDQLKANPLTSLTAAPNQTKAPNYKDELIPPQLMTLVESFKTFVKDQKSSSSVVNRASLKQITKVTEDAELLKRMTMQLERTVNKNKFQNKKLREDVARVIQDSEIVHRLSMDPRGFPTDNTLAFDYFRTIVDRFQQQAESLTVELKSMEKHIACKLHPSPFTPEELSATMKQLYECFVALAGRYQSIHSSVTSLKLDLQRKKDPWYALNAMGYYQSNTLLK